MIKIIKADEHYRSQIDWLDTTHHFSFGEYHNPEKMNFGPLRVFNDDTIKPGTGFDLHQHHDMEIITYVIDGELEHKDNQGNHGIIQPGEVQRMSAGTGIMHAEFNHSEEKPLRLLQMWILPNKNGLEPSWEQQKFTREERMDKLLLVVAPDDAMTEKALHIHQDVMFLISSLTPNHTVEYKSRPERKSYLFVIDGEIQLNQMNMKTRDAARIENENQLLIISKKPTELLLIDLPATENA
ncbi:MAG TPA: pirin family protein [Nitrosopumilaceae archaeon]|nr:pirin family protein [Nitrosopumilaceae archaeon]